MNLPTHAQHANLRRVSSYIATHKPKPCPPSCPSCLSYAVHLPPHRPTVIENTQLIREGLLEIGQLKYQLGVYERRIEEREEVFVYDMGPDGDGDGEEELRDELKELDDVVADMNRMIEKLEAVVEKAKREVEEDFAWFYRQEELGLVE